MRKIVGKTGAILIALTMTLVTYLVWYPLIALYQGVEGAASCVERFLNKCSDYLSRLGGWMNGR